MKFKNCLLIASEMERSLQFYQEIMGLKIVLDFKDYVILTGGIVLQTQKSWALMIGKVPQEICYEGNDAELIFEEEEFDQYLERLKLVQGISYVHSLLKKRWGQRVIRFYDPDGHIIEVTESLKQVCRRYLGKGFSAEEIAAKMEVPLEFVTACQQPKKKAAE